MKAMIFAAGLGSRLKPITDTRPKALVTVGGKTMLEHIILKLKAAGFDEIVINVHHFSNQILAFLEANQNFGERMASNRISVGVMVRMLPNRKADKSGVNPGARKLKIIPTAIPKVQNTAIAESSRISFRLLNHSTPKEESTEKIAADNRGEIPAYNPRPIPPKEAWVIPPLMNTKRRVTMYVPIMPQAMLANKLPSKACWKKV